jgi:hypothetical protein
MAQKVYVASKVETRRAYVKDEEGMPEDERTWFEHRKMTEGDYGKYVDLTSQIKLGSKEEDERAEMDMKLGTTRIFLLTTLGVDWNVIDEKGAVIAMSQNNIKRLPPELVKEWVDDVFDFNPILRNDKEDKADKDSRKKGK